jgi:hypothetical protein
MPQHRVRVRNARSLMTEISGAENSARELRSYLLAIQSYEDQLSLQPDLNFQQHLANVMSAEYRLACGSLRREN